MNKSEIDRRIKSKERSDKALLELVKESSRLRNAKWSAPLVELEKPFQRGWVRFFALSAKAKHRKDSKELEKLLSFLNNKQYSRRRDFCVRQGKSKKWIPMSQGLQRLHVHEILKRKIPENLFRYLLNFKYESLGNWDNAEKLRRLHYPWKFGVSDPTLFELVVEPNWITHHRVVMPEVESRLTEIEAYMHATCGWERYYHLKGYRKWRYSVYDLRRDEQIMRQVEKEWLEFLSTTEKPLEKGTDNTVPFFWLSILLKHIRIRVETVAT